tara:strand:+ start:248 stop:574 length:327 start_codon:yes stop_codon:yes gene_type:complete
MSTNYTINENGVTRAMTDVEKAQWDKDSASSTSKDRKLNRIKRLRLQKLKQTDWMSNSDYTMPSYIKTWRQTLRDLPQNNTSESQYDALLTKDSNGKLTNSVWTQPTE